MTRRLLAVIAALAALAAGGCRPSTEIRPAFTRETPMDAGLPGRIVFTSQADRNDVLLDLTPGPRARPESLRIAAGDQRRSPALSADGSRLAFSVVGQPGGIWTSAPDGADPRPVIEGEGYFDHPTWSPDGARIAYAHTNGADRGWDLFVVDAVGGEPQPLIDSPGQDWYPAWSPDGSTIAFTSDRDGDDAIWLLDVATGEQTKVVDSDGADAQPAWSPDGDRIVFTSDRELERWQLFIYDVADGSDEIFLRTTAQDRFPTFSPDGRYILVSIGYLAVYRADATKFDNGADRWKLTDRLAFSSVWLPEGGA